MSYAEAVFMTWQRTFSRSLRLWQEALLSPTATEQAGNSHDFNAQLIKNSFFLLDLMLAETCCGQLTAMHMLAKQQPDASILLSIASPIYSGKHVL